MKPIPVERAVRDRLQHVVGADVRGAGEVGQGAGDLEDPVVGAGGEVQLLHRVLQIGRAFGP